MCTLFDSANSTRRSRFPSAFAALLVVACGQVDEPVAIEIDPRWSLGVPLPMGLTDAAAAVVNGSIMVAGGQSAEGPSLHVYRFTPGATSWERMADLPDYRVGGRLVVSDGTPYLVGGTHVVDNVHFQDRRVYSHLPAEDRWVEVASFPDLRDGDAVAVPGGIVVVGGGFGSADHGGTFPGDSAVMYIAASSSWRYAAPIGTPRHRPLAVASGSIVHVFGGQYLDGSGTPREIEIYDAMSDTWSAGGQFVDYGRIVGQAHARVGDHVHFFGVVAAVPGAPVIETHFRYHIPTDDWEVLPQLPTPRARAAAVVLDGRIHVIGGLRGPRFVPTSFADVVEIYDVR